MKKFPAFLTTRLPANEYNIWHTCLVKLALKARIFSYIFNRLGATINSLQRKDRTTTSDKLIVFVNEKISCALQYVIYTATSTSKIVIKETFFCHEFVVMKHKLYIFCEYITLSREKYLSKIPFVVIWIWRTIIVYPPYSWCL